MKQWILLWLLLPLFSFAQTLPGIAEKTKGMQLKEGFIPFYWDENTGKIFWAIDQFDTELLYQTGLAAGLGSNDLGLDRGLLGNTAIIKFQKVGNKVLMVQPNYQYRAVTNDAAERKAVVESFASSTLWGFSIEAVEGNKVLVDATAFLLRDAMQVIQNLQQNKQGNYSTDATRSAIYLPRTKNFPLNSEFESTITYITKDANPGNFVSSVTPNPEAITLRIHQSLIQLPDNQYQPRLYDPRSPYITQSFFDYSTPVSSPIEKHYILRHRLNKKDPSAAVSEAVKPIVYYLDNGTPEPIRSALMEGASWWNAAFEAAGFKDAFQVKLLPEDADPMDLRYNVINWVHRSTRGWSYGASVVDPRTGEIIKGHVTLGSLRVRQDYLIAQGLLAPFEKGEPTNDKMLAMALQRLKQLAAHEVGHTIGLMHNYISSTQNRASVMDYPAPQVQLSRNGNIELTDAYTNTIGDWDKVSINYGYREFPAGTNEQQALEKILATAEKEGLTFISDRDARDPGGLHPKAHLWDVYNDPVKGLSTVIAVRKKALENFGLNAIRKGQSTAMLEDVLVPIYLLHRYQVEAVTKIIGGLNYSYAVKGDGQITTAPIDKKEQQKALTAVLECIDPSFLSLPERILSLIPPRPAGYEYNRELFKRRTGLLFDPLAAAEAAAELPLSLLFHPARLNRLSQFPELNRGMSITECFDQILQSTWKANKPNGLAGLIKEQNEQLVLTYLMRAYVSPSTSFATKAAIMDKLSWIKEFAENKVKANEHKGYYLMTLDRIEKREEAKPFVPEVLPPGAPIGCSDSLNDD